MINFVRTVGAGSTTKGETYKMKFTNVTVMYAIPTLLVQLCCYGISGLEQPDAPAKLGTGKVLGHHE